MARDVRGRGRRTANSERRTAVALLSLLAVVGCGGGGGDDGPPPAREFDAARAMTYVQQQLAFGSRIPGTPAHAAMAGWLDSLARTKADTVVVQRWNHVTAHGDSLPMVNVVARFNPAAASRILYVAHWDTRPRADAPTSRQKMAPVPGANDGASGVAVLLGVMDLLATTRPTVGVDLLFVDGEDYGTFIPLVDALIGSTWYARNLLPPGKPDFAVVWDMVGGQNLRISIEQGSGIAAPDVITRVWSVAERMGYGHIFVKENQGPILDDHTPLIKAGIRAIDVIGFPYAHWHTPDDTFDKISAASLEAVGNVAIGVIREYDKK